MTFTLMSEKYLWYPLEWHSAVGGWEQNNANVHAWDCLGMGLEWTRATPPKVCPTVDSPCEEKAQETLNNSTALSTWLAKVEAKLLLSPLSTFWNEEMYPWMFFANITVGKSATIILLLMLLFCKIFFRISCTSSKNIFGVMLKKEMPINIPFLYSIQTNVQTLYTSMNTSYQFFDLIATIVSNN